ncbi:MAG: flavodoxin family protein [Candidatus Lokiarchaeota archaeon]|nr:flavodoxin family protein [Candidatus Lokiarchaeota archaeon]
MKVVAFIGSARKKHTYNAVKQLMNNLQSFDAIEYEIVQLSNYRLEVCKGCKTCINKGEEFCPLNDDRDILIEKMINSDGIIFASPNYFFQISGLMKIFLDRIAFFGHRPLFFGKAFTSLVVQGVYGGKKLVKYLDFIGKVLGCNVTKGCCLNSLEPMTEKGQNKINKILNKQSKKFYSNLIKKEYTTPSLLQLTMFRITRTSMKLAQNETFRDYEYYKKNGWFESNYYHPVQLGPFKKTMGKLFDKIAASVVHKR